MVHLTTKILGLVISAIKNLCEIKGSTSREILRYVSSIYNVPYAVARRQMRSVLKRGVTCGILKKTGNHYSLPIDNETARQEVAIQEIGLLDLYCQRGVRRSRDRRARTRKRVCRCGRRRARRRRSRGCGPRTCKRRQSRRRRSRRRRRRRCRCGGLGRRACSGTKRNLDDDKLTRSDRTVTDNETIAAEQSHSNLPLVE